MAKATSINLSFDYRWIIGLLLVVIGAMLIVWKPWVTKVDQNTPTVSVTGTATVRAAPDEFGFYPSYLFTGSEKAVPLSQANAKGTEIVNKLKELGVKDSQIKSRVDGSRDYKESYAGGESYSYSLSVVVTLGDKDLSQKVQDYLVTTGPEGSVTPTPTFSEAKRKQLESEARDKATKDARSKAEQSAKNLGFSVGNIKKVNDGAGFNGLTPMYEKFDLGVSSVAPITSMTLQPGENDLQYSVSVEYYVR